MKTTAYRGFDFNPQPKPGHLAQIFLVAVVLAFLYCICPEDCSPFERHQRLHTTGASPMAVDYGAYRQLQSGRYSDSDIRNAAPAVGLVCVIPAGTAVSIERRMAQGLFQVEILEGEHKGKLLLAQDDWLARDEK
jgi:hypothetical protein